MTGQPPAVVHSRARHGRLKRTDLEGFGLELAVRA
jgi:hypothetical protein